jgi:hypothetical protein
MYTHTHTHTYTHRGTHNPMQSLYYMHIHIVNTQYNRSKSGLFERG